MDKMTHIYWTPCAVHYIDFMLKDTGRATGEANCRDGTSYHKVHNIFIHRWVLDLMKQYVGEEILRPSMTWFATNYVASKSLLNNKSGLKTMFTFNKWMKTKYGKSSEDKRIKGTVQCVECGKPLL